MEKKQPETQRFTMPDRPDMVYRFSRDRAPTADELIRMYLSRIGSKGGKIGGCATTPAKRRASRANGLKGGRPRKVKG